MQYLQNCDFSFFKKMSSQIELILPLGPHSITITSMKKWQIQITFYLYVFNTKLESNTRKIPGISRT